VSNASPGASSDSRSRAGCRNFEKGGGVLRKFAHQTTPTLGGMMISVRKKMEG